jgi:hypothetical protein
MRRLHCFFIIALSIFGLFLPTGLPLAQAQTGLAYSPAALFIWTDKYVYQPGEPITLRWSARANGDTNPYTVVIYRQNNQTGGKTFFPGQTGTVTDIVGRSPDTGFQTFILGDVTKGVVIGTGGWLATSTTAPDELGMHTFVVELRDAAGGRVIKSAYFKIGVVSGFEDLTGTISVDRTLSNTVAYRLSGIVTVRARLTIPPGTFILGQPGSQPPSVLLVTQLGQLDAQGTRSRPIIFTSSQPFGSRRAGDWGGVILLGQAPVNWPTGFGNVEGLPATDDTRYGGTDPEHSCGTLRYVRVEFAGAEFQPNQEVNAFTFGGCGRGTVAEHLEAKYGLDDLFEWFGGTMDAKYLVGVNARDDYLDGQIGWTGRLQHVLAVAGKDVPGNRGIEMDNNENNFAATPLGKVQFYNLTFVGAGDTLTAGFDEGADVAAVWLRRGAAGTYHNMLLYNWISNGFTIRDNATTDNVNRLDLTVDGLIMFDNGKALAKANSVAGQVSGSSSNQALPFIDGTRGQARNVLVADPLLRRPLFTSDPDFLPRSGSPALRANWVQPPDDGFFDQWARWSGAFGDVDWTEEWTSFHTEEEIRP